MTSGIDTFHTSLRQVLRSGAQREEQWQVFQAQARESRWDYHTLDKHKQDAWAILHQTCPNTTPDRSKIVRLVLDIYDFLLASGANPLRSQHATHPLWGSGTLIGTHPFSHLVAQDLEPWRSEHNENPLHLLGRLSVPPQSIDPEEYPFPIHADWVHERNSDGLTPLQTVWLGDKATQAQEALAGAQSLRRAHISIGELWGKTHYLLSLGADMGVGDADGVPLTVTIWNKVNNGLRVDTIPNSILMGVGQYNGDAVRGTQAEVQCRILEHATAPARGVRSHGARL